MRKGKVNMKSECKCGGGVSTTPIFLEEGMHEVDWNKCDKKSICAGHPDLCSNCRKRHGNKVNYYEPEIVSPYFPYYPGNVTVHYG